MQAQPIHIACLGEVMLELVLGETTQAQLGIAGDTYNTAVYIARDPRITQVDYITGLGDDSFSDRIRAHMHKYNIGDKRVFTHPARGPGLYAIETDANGERSFAYWRSEAAARCLGDPDMPAISELLDGVSHLYYSGISLAILSQGNRDRLFEAITEFRAGGGVVAFDSNYRPRLWANAGLARQETARAWRNCDIALPSVDDEMALFGDRSETDVLARFAQYGVTQGALKRGEKGPIGLDGTVLAAPAKAERVIDTTAAGDSFNAQFLVEYISGGTREKAMDAGHRLAAQVVAHKGAIIF
jgi:2-dehydro-3-deoxygluconokinase